MNNVSFDGMIDYVSEFLAVTPVGLVQVENPRGRDSGVVFEISEESKGKQNCTCLRNHAMFTVELSFKTRVPCCGNEAEALCLTIMKYS